MLMTSLGTNYLLIEHEDVNQYGSIAIPSNITPHQSYPESLVDQNELPIDWVIMLISSSGTNHVRNKHEDVDHYDPYALPYKIMPC